MDNFSNDNIKVEYGFRFEVHLQSKNIVIVIVQMVPLTMFSPFKEANHIQIGSLIQHWKKKISSIISKCDHDALPSHGVKPT
jgi:hypothetical protein